MLTYFEAIIFWISVILLHEFGHYLAFMPFFPRLKPYMKFTWFGMMTGTIHTYRMKAIELIFVAYVGIFAGMFPFYFVETDITWFMFYLLMCSVDIAIILLQSNKNVGKTYLELTKIQYDNMLADKKKFENG